jgi:integrase
LKFSLEQQKFNSNDEINIDELCSFLRKNASKNQISQVKNGLKLLFKSKNKYLYYGAKKINMVMEEKKDIPKRQKKSLDLKNINRRINALGNKKLKVAYRLMQVSGLRTEEVANLRKNDLAFTNDNRIDVFVRKGKGSKQRRFKSKQDKYVYEELKKMLENLKDDDKIFYSSSYMRDNAAKLGFNCHKMRKLFATDIFLKSSLGKEETLTLIRKLLGHSDNDAIKRYIDLNGTELNTTGTKWDI